MYRLGKLPSEMNENHSGHFLVHRTQFLTDSVTWGLDLRLRDPLRPLTIIKDRILCQETVSDEGLRSKDRERGLISEVSEGLCGRKQV